MARLVWEAQLPKLNPVDYSADLRADIAAAIANDEFGPPLGPPILLNDCPVEASRVDMPLFEAVYWVATKGGAAGFDVAIRQIWDNAWAEVVASWRLNTLVVTGRPARGGFPEKIGGENVADVKVIHPWNVDLFVDHPVSGARPYIRSFGRNDAESWEKKGFDDQLCTYAKKHGWTHLQVLKADVQRLWPFGQGHTSTLKAGRPAPAASLRGVRRFNQQEFRKAKPGNRVKRTIPVLDHKRFTTDRPSPADTGSRELVTRQEPATKSIEDKKTDALAIAKMFVRNGVAPNVKTHATLVMGRLKTTYPQNHLLRKNLEVLLDTTFKGQRRSAGRP